MTEYCREYPQMMMQALGFLVYQRTPNLENGDSTSEIESIGISDNQGIDFLIGIYLNNRDYIFDAGYTIEEIGLVRDSIFTSGLTGNESSNLIGIKYFVLTEMLLEEMSNNDRIYDSVDLRDGDGDEDETDDDIKLPTRRSRIIDRIFSCLVEDLDNAISINAIVFPSSMGTHKVDQMFDLEELFKIKEYDFDPDLADKLILEFNSNPQVRGILGFIEVLKWANSAMLKDHDQARIRRGLYGDGIFVHSEDIN